MAFSLARFGLPVSYVTLLPNNPIADAGLAFLRGAGVDTSHVVRREGRMGIYFLEAGANQRPSVVVYDRAHSVDHGRFPDGNRLARSPPRRGVVSCDGHYAGPQRGSGRA